jgi:hypothetical protein
MTGWRIFIIIMGVVGTLWALFCSYAIFSSSCPTLVCDADDIRNKCVFIGFEFIGIVWLWFFVKFCWDLGDENF